MAGPDPIDPALRIGAVRLAVADLARSADFYARVLGLALISRDQHSALLGVDRARPALELTSIPDPTPVSPHSTGLFHVAWLHPSRASLAASVQRIVRERWPIDGAADHGVSEALYLSDPDGLGIEIYADRPRDQWERPADAEGVSMFTLPLDLDGLIAQAPEQRQDRMPSGTSVGHVHLKVSDVARAAAFYRDVLGLQEQAKLPSAAFLSAGGYHHHIGLNSWQSSGQGAPAQTAPGLRVVEFYLSSADELTALERRVAGVAGQAPSTARESERLSVSDADAQRLMFTVAPAAVSQSA